MIGKPFNDMKFNVGDVVTQKRDKVVVGYRLILDYDYDFDENTEVYKNVEVKYDHMEDMFFDPKRPICFTAKEDIENNYELVKEEDDVFTDLFDMRSCFHDL